MKQEHVDPTGKTFVAVGANVELGFEATKKFASMNPKKLVLGCRSQAGCHVRAALNKHVSDVYSSPT